MSTARKYGKSTLSSSTPVPSGQFLNLFANDLNPNAPTNENATPRTITTIFGGTSSSYDSSLDPGGRRKAPKAKKINLDTAIGEGHHEDVAFLLSKATSADPHLPYLGLCKISFYLPKEWTFAQQSRCRLWLVDQLGFEERLLANEPAYSHSTTKVSHYKAHFIAHFLIEYSNKITDVLL